MTKITAKIDGMMCGMCENHINDAVRQAFPVKKVSSSFRKKETVILTDAEIDEASLRSVIDQTGYRLISIHSEPYQKKSMFGSRKSLEA